MSYDQDWCYEDLPEDDDEPGHPDKASITGHPLLVTCQRCIERFGLKEIRDNWSKHEVDPDFRQRMHFMGPAGYGPCTRPEWPHDGPCAHRKLTPLHRGVRGGWIALDWYDGPIIEVCRVTYNDGSAPLAEVRAFGRLDPLDDDKVRIRLTREELQAMIDVIDGKPVLGYLTTRFGLPEDAD